ncbi:MAG: hypothetical protein ACI865_001556 [Flavobacteriaceae bacterium]|jgi:hypothetical protein
MESIFKQKLGNDFEKLHPKIQQQFGFNSADHMASVGVGVMEKVWHGNFYTLPLLYLGKLRNVLFPEKGTMIPFSMESYAYKDSFGRETVSLIRKYQFEKHIRRFDETMILSKMRKRLISYLGTHQNLAVDIEVSVGQNGGICFHSGQLRFYQGSLAFVFPHFFSGEGDVCEWYDDNEKKYKISVKVNNRIWGKFFGYEGSFDVGYMEVNSKDDIPKDALPVREEIRD